LYEKTSSNVLKDVSQEIRYMFIETSPDKILIALSLNKINDVKKLLNDATYDVSFLERCYVRKNGINTAELRKKGCDEDESDTLIMLIQSELIRSGYFSIIDLLCDIANFQRHNAKEVYDHARIPHHWRLPQFY
jgi:hypothetical protein